MTLAELQARLSEKGIAFGICTLWRFFQRHRITLKKVGARAEQDRPDIVAIDGKIQCTACRWQGA